MAQARRLTLIFSFTLSLKRTFEYQNGMQLVTYDLVKVYRYYANSVGSQKFDDLFLVA